MTLVYSKDSRKQDTRQSN